MLWPTTILRFAWCLLTWEYLGQALALCFNGAELWVDIVRGCCLYWLIGKLSDPVERSGLFENESTKWKRKRKAIQRQMANIGNQALNQIDKAVTWAIGNEPTYKERLTWTSATFSCQQRVRKDRSRGQGYNKRRLGTSDWFRTASIVCLLATSGKAKSTRFDSDSVTLHIDNCASRCITHSLGDFVTDPQKVIGRVKGIGGDNIAVQAVGTIRWTFDDDDGVAHSFLIPGHFTSRSRLLGSSPRNTGRRPGRTTHHRRMEHGKPRLPIMSC